MGWRYFPGSHDRKPCFCPGCLVKGEYGTSDDRKEWESENSPLPMKVAQAKDILLNSTDTDELYRAMWVFGRKKRRENPEFLFRVFEMNDEVLNYDGIKILGNFTHQNARQKLWELSQSSDQECADLAKELLRKKGDSGTCRHWENFCWCTDIEVADR